jgi:hypothetical protein
MAAENEEEKEESAGEKKKSGYWWLTLALLFVFLAGSGYLFISATRAASRRMAGATDQYASDTSGPGGSAAHGADGPFASEEAPSTRVQAAGSALNAKLTPGWVKELAEAREPSGQAGASTALYGAQGEGQNRGGAAPVAGQAGAMAQKLQARVSSGFGGAPGASRTSAQGQADAFQGSGTSVGKASVQRQTASGSPKKSSGGGVLDALKGTFRASLYGARVASQDSAKSWIAKAFDATPDYDTAVQYDDNVRAQLDKVNPNAIPNFLRDQDISAAEAKTLQASDVSAPQVDKDAQEEESKAYQQKKAASSLASGMLNSLFSGLDSGSPASSDSGSSGAANSRAVTAGADPNSDPSLLGVDNSYTTVDSGDGSTSYVFGPDGNIVGCEDDSAGMCLMPGAGGCPSGLSLS